MPDLDLSEEQERELVEFESLPIAEQDERLAAELCGMPLEPLLEAMHDAGERREFLGSYGMLKIGTAASEVLGSQELMGPEDRAELAIIFLELVTVAARDAGAHLHKLASGLRSLARSLG